jgi:hypothetical protein
VYRSALAELLRSGLALAPTSTAKSTTIDDVNDERAREDRRQQRLLQRLSELWRVLV